MVTRPRMVTRRHRIEERQRRSATSPIDAGLAKQLRWVSLEDTTSDVENLEECDCSSRPNGRCVVYQRNAFLRQTGVRKNRGEGLRLLPRNVWQARTQRSRRLLRCTRAFS